ncbi:MAG: hypothetical protein K2G38_05020, partial [Clostridia bacterium]|nr:hypothetical protein [Clostridia bacterium]
RVYDKYHSRGLEIYQVGFDGDEYKCVLVPEGKYTITYHQADNKITYQAGTHEMYFRGSGEGMSWSDCLADFKLTDNDGYWTGTLTLKANDEVKVYNKLQTGDEAWYGYNGTGDNYKAETDGEYFFKFTEESGLLEVEKVEYWLIGTFLDAEDEKVDFEIKSGVTPKGEVAEGVVTWEIEVKDVTTQYDWLTHADWCDNTENVVMCVKIVCSTELIGKDGQNAAGKTGNLYINEGAGTYTVTYDIENGTYQITKKAA